MQPTTQNQQVPDNPIRVSVNRILTAPTISEIQPPASDSGGPESPKPPVPPSDSFESVIFVNSITDHSNGPLSVGEAIARYLTLRVAEGVSPDGDTYRHLTKHLGKRFCQLHGNLPLRTIRADHIRAWSASLTDERTLQPLSQLTRRHHLVSLKTFFRRCWREGWIERDPTLPIVLPQVQEEDVNVIPVADAFHFFRVNRGHRAIGRLALEAFGGLRYTTAGKLVYADLKFERRGIEMPSSKHKSRKRRFRQGQPSNMWAWATHAPRTCWDLTIRQYRDEKKEMLCMAGLRPMVLKSDEDRARADELKNVWRHSFASYLLAKTKDYAPIAYLMQHARATTTEVYEGIADELDAVRYFAITPQTVLLSWAEFCASVQIPAPAFSP